MLSRFLEKLISVDEAVVKAVDSIVLRLERVEVSVWNALGLILAEDVVARFDQPPFNRSAVDGYAVKSSDTFGASQLNPVRLRLIGTMATGDTPDKYVLGYGEAVEVSTGAPLPEGADAVVMVEDTNRFGEYVEVYKPVAPYENVSKKGEDYRRGEVIVSRNKILAPWDLAIIASNGYDKVVVYEKLRVGIMCTGNEVVEPGFKAGSGEVYNSTGVLVKNYLAQHSFIEPRYYGVFSDDYSVVRDALEKIIAENHVAITCGGAGVSDVDVVRDVIGDLGEYVFRGVAMRPGRPTSLALVEGKPVFMLSGYPVAAWTGLEALVTPILYRVLGLQPPVKPVVKARLKRRVPNVIGYRSYIRVRVWVENGEYMAEPYMLRGSGVLSSLVKSNGYIVIPENTEGYQEGDLVEVTLYTM